MGDGCLSFAEPHTLGIGDNQRMPKAMKCSCRGIWKRGELVAKPQAQLDLAPGFVHDTLHVVEVVQVAKAAEILLPYRLIEFRADSRV